MKQEQFLQQVLELKKQNPEMEIHLFVDSDEITDYRWSHHEICKVEISEWFHAFNEIMTDEDMIRAYLTEEADDGLSEEQLKVYVDSRYAEEVTMAICVYTRAK